MQSNGGADMGGLESILSPELVDAMQRLWGPTGAGLIAALIALGYVVGPLMKKNKEQSDPLASIKAQIADVVKATAEQDDEIADMDDRINQNRRDHDSLKIEVDKLIRRAEADDAISRHMAREQTHHPWQR